KVAVEPGQGGIPLYGGEDCGFFGGGPLGLLLEFLGAKLALLRAGELLHDADAAHRHEVLREAEGISAVDGQVFNASLQRWIGKLAGRDRHLARCKNRSILRSELPRTISRNALGSGQA